MNRAQRRAAARGKNQEQYKVVQLPPFFDENFIFQGMEHLLDRLESGYLDEVNGEYVLRNGADDFTSVIPNLNSWISCWKRYDQRFQLNHDLSALVRLCNCLQHQVRIPQTLVKSAKAVIKEQRRLFKLLPRDEVAKTARIEQTYQYMMEKAA